MKWLILGGSGFTGKHLIDALTSVNPNDIIINVDLIPSSITKIKNYQKDLLNQNILYEILDYESPDYIINLIGIMKSDDIQLLINANSLLLLKICEYYKNNVGNLKQILSIGSAAQYGPLFSIKELPRENSICRPNNFYGWSKLFQEIIGLEYYLKYNLPLCFTRTANIIGPGLGEKFVIPTIIHQMKKIMTNKSNHLLKLRTINSGRDFIDIRDAVTAYIKIITSEKASGNVFNVGTGNWITLIKIIDILKKILGIENLTLEGEKLEKPDIHALNCDKLFNYLDWKPKFDIEQTLHDML